METPRQTLVLFELHHLGDAVMSLPFIRACQERMNVVVVCSPGSEIIFHQALPPENVLAWKAVWKGGTQWGALRTFMRRWRPDIGACVWADSRVHGLMRMLGINKRVGFPMNETNYYAHTIAWRARQLSRGRFLERALNWLPGPLLTTPLTRKSYEQHHLDDWGQIASALGLSYSIQPPWVHVEPIENGYWLLHPGGRLPSKRWPAERFQAVVDGYFAKNDLPLVIVHPPEGLEIAARHPLHKVVKPATIFELWRWIAGARGVLCNDSLAAHLAASCGKPVLAIFGSANPNWFSPGNDPASVIESRVCPHRPCLDECQRPRFECLEAVTVAQVIERCRERFGGAMSA